MAATQEDLINQQFAESAKGLAQKKKQAIDEAQIGVQRQQAIGGLTGGGAVKAQQRAQQGLEDTYGTQEAGLNVQKAQQLQQVAATQQAQEFQKQMQQQQQQFATGERTGSQEYAASEAQKQRDVQNEQFQKTFGLQQKQYDSAVEQFNKQMGFQQAQFSADQFTNMINAMTALDKSGAADPVRWGNLQNILQSTYHNFGQPQLTTDFLAKYMPNYKTY